MSQWLLGRLLLHTNCSENDNNLVLISQSRAVVNDEYTRIQALKMYTIKSSLLFVGTGGHEQVEAALDDDADGERARRLSMCEASELLMLATAVCEVRGLAVGDGVRDLHVIYTCYGRSHSQSRQGTNTGTRAEAGRGYPCAV